MSDTAIATPTIVEDYESQIPAVQFLMLMGWNYLTRAEVSSLRGSRSSNVIVDGILESQLRNLNRIRYRGEEIPFSEGNIVAAIQALKEMLYDGLIRTNEKVYDLLCLGKSLQQSIRGDLKSFTLQYVDWEHPERNVYHIAEEFEVQRAGRKDAYVPDIVLFVNGIPLAIIECKRSELEPGHLPIPQAISQQLRNQKEDGIPQLFVYAQLLLALSRKEARYGTVGTPEKFWSVWKEHSTDSEITQLLQRGLSKQQKECLFEGRLEYAKANLDLVGEDGIRAVTEQDRALWSLCRPERLLELAYRFVLFDAGEKKIARYQQYFTVRSILKRINSTRDGRRLGGVVWHTQGSGKSLTMVMLARAIALMMQDPVSPFSDYRIVLVTDRVDLDEQIHRTFHHCGVDLVQATTGADLIDILSSSKDRVISTVINKFDAAMGKGGKQFDSPNIIVLVDEGHRTHYGSMHAKMRRVLPNACFIAFTGTPVMRQNKNTIERFDGLIEPIYTIADAVKDKAVVPLLYEGRLTRQRVDQQAIDEWFERETADLSKAEKSDLKTKFATTEQLFRAEPVVKAIAWDVSEHFARNWKGTPFKAQLVAPRKETAILYKSFFDSFGKVNTQVLISPPDEREGEEAFFEKSTDRVALFWKAMMDRYGTPKEYERQVINAFKYSDSLDDPQNALEIIIVVDKLLTGFDCPRNTVLYLARQLKEHTLLQAIARVNRLHKGKDYGYIIDFRGVLPQLDEALDLYSELPEFDEDDLVGTVTDIAAVIDKLPQKHSALWDVFKTVRNKRDVEAYELLLADDAARIDFYDRFGAFARALAVALSSEVFLERAPSDQIDRYKADLKFFKTLRQSVRRRYAEVIDYSEYEPRIKKLLDTYIGAEQVDQITGPVDLFDDSARTRALEEAHGTAAKAHTIAYNTKRVLEERWHKEDPAFYRKFSRMLEDVIEAFRQQRLEAAEFLKQSSGIMDAVITRTGDQIPEVLSGNETAKAYYGSIWDILQPFATRDVNVAEISAEAALEFNEIVDRHRIVDWGTNADIQNRIRQNFEDYLFDLKARTGMTFDLDSIDRILDECIAVAKVRRP